MAPAAEPGDARDRPLACRLLSSDYLPNIGGIAAHVHGLARGLSGLGHEVEVVVPTLLPALTPPRERGEVEKGVQVVRVGFTRIPRLTRYYAPGWVARRLARRFAVRPPDVLHWHAPLLDSQIAARLPGPLRVFTNHTSQFIEWQVEGRDPALAAATIAPADVVIAPSRQAADATLMAGFPPEWVRRIPNAVDPERFSPEASGEAVRRQLGIGSDDVVVLCPRRFDQAAGIPFWLRSLPAVAAGAGAGVRFLLVGDYPGQDRNSDKEAILRLMRELDLGDRLVWAGAVPNERMPGFLAASDLVVLPSLYEATSIAGLEAMACGKPLIASDVGGLPEIVDHEETGLLVPPRSPEALAAAILSLLRAPERRLEMGARARRKVVDHFSWSAIAARTAALYLEALRGRVLSRTHGDGVAGLRTARTRSNR